jgi:hypothetical protein
MIYIPFGCASGNIDHKPGMSHYRNTENENKRCKIFNKVLNMNWDYVRGKKNKQKENKNNQTKRKQKNKKNKKIYYITKQRACETISIIKMLTISKNLLWPRDLESFKGGNITHFH